MDPEVEKTNCVKIADRLEEVLLEELTKDAPSAAMIQAARQYLKDQGFVAQKRPNANITPLKNALEEAERERGVPFPVDDESEATSS